MIGPAGRCPSNKVYWGYTYCSTYCILHIVAFGRMLCTYPLMKEVLFVTNAI